MRSVPVPLFHAHSLLSFSLSFTLSFPPSLPPIQRRLVHSLSLSCALLSSPLPLSLSPLLPLFSVTLAHAHELSPSVPLSISVSFHDYAPRARRSERRVRERTETAPPPRLTRSFAPAAHSVFVRLSTYLSRSLSRPSRQSIVGISRDNGIAGTRTRHALPGKRAEVMRAIFVNLPFPSAREKMER